MAFYTFLTQVQQLAGQTIPGTLTVSGLLTTQAGITNGGAAITNSGQQYTGTGAARISIPGSVDVSGVGNGLQVKEGSNAKQGTFTLSGAATTVVANTSVTATSRIFMQTATLGTVTVASTLAYTVSAGVSFTVTPSQATDTSTVAFEIFEAG